MAALVLKIGGNVVQPRSTNLIDLLFIEKLFDYVDAILVKRYKHIIILPGGIGGELFINWGRQAGCSEVELSAIGCSLINMSAAILNRISRLKLGHRLKVCPYVPLTLTELALSVDQFEVVICGCSIPGAITSDSLGALIAEHTNSDFAMVKNGPPFDGEVSFYTDQTSRTISLSKLISFYSSLAYTELAGRFPSIDYQCLRVIRRSRIPTTIILKKTILDWRDGVLPQPITIQHDC